MLEKDDKSNVCFKLLVCHEYATNSPNSQTVSLQLMSQHAAESEVLEMAFKNICLALLSDLLTDLPINIPLHIDEHSNKHFISPSIRPFDRPSNKHFISPSVRPTHILMHIFIA